MLLTVDVGNTNVVFGLYEGAELRQTFRASTDRTRTADEYGVLLRQLISLRHLDRSDVKAAIMASVVPPLTDVMTDAIRHAFAIEPLVVGPGTKTGISILYDNPREVGADRIVNAVAAFERVQSGLIVVDFGTATTFDCISPRGEYLGGIIAPGLQVSLDGLLSRAAKLTRIELTEPPKVLGKNTTHALQSGLILGCASLVDGLIDKLVEELGFACHVIATGGLAPLIVRHTQRVDEIDEHLTLDGLRILYARNGAVEGRGAARRRSARG